MNPIARKRRANWRSLLALAALISFAPASSDVPDEPSTAWAYPIAPRVPAPVRADPSEQIRIPGSNIMFTRAEVTDRFFAPDWQPKMHRPMPPVVASGRKPDVRACGYCHLPSGNGRPENAALAGLPRDYIVAQMAAFASGDRRSSVGDRDPQTIMTASAKAATDADIAAAADYFAALPHTNFTRVVETSQVPRNRTNAWLYSRDPAGGTEPLGARIIEMPNDFDRFEKRDPAMGYRAYVPIGSIARGRRLAGTCAACHGPAFKGVGDIPPLAGRSPSYIVRQLNDFKTGARAGSAAALMKPVVAPLRNADMIALAAFLGSRTP